MAYQPYSYSKPRYSLPYGMQADVLPPSDLAESSQTLYEQPHTENYHHIPNSFPVSQRSRSYLPAYAQPGHAPQDTYDRYGPGLGSAAWSVRVLGVGTDPAQQPQQPEGTPTSGVEAQGIPKFESNE
jgi:hypothetical protein